MFWNISIRLKPVPLALTEGAMRSDVFGGMGSGNDLPCMYEPEYEEVSNAPFTELHNTISAAANSLLENAP